ncbi:MAG: hydrogenase formation protein HypD [Planctomycetota bacterium]|jgi:hydrogenase expression/formation protein HypD
MTQAALSAEAVSSLLRRVERAVSAAGRPVRLMEVCGTHTTAIFRSGIRSILPGGLELVSGPGCPVCVTPPGYMDRAIAISRIPGVTVATYGDMIRVPGSEGSLERERSQGADVRVVYSSTDALELAKEHPDQKVVFLAVGFETTAPGIAATALAAERDGVENFYLLAAPKLIPPAMEAVLSGGAALDGFLCPGHVSVIIGAAAYEPVVREHRVPCVVTGFEPPEILLGIAMACEQVASGRAGVEVAYRHAVRDEGNPAARAVMYDVFEPVDAEWRGLGIIPESGLALKGRFSAMDAGKKFEVEVPASREPEGCRCGEVLAGTISPAECGLFARACTPETPVGPCMVSSEGTCAAHFKYGRRYNRARGREKQ